MKFLSRLASLALSAAVLFSLAGVVFAEGYPNKPIRLIVPWPPGGGADTLGRPIGQKLSESLGQPVVIDNRPGAAGSIGSAMAAKAAPDGYTLLLNYVSDSAINPSLYSNLGYDPMKDFAPVTQIAAGLCILVVNPSVPVKSVQELISLAKSKPGQLNYASAGNGSVGHLAAELFKAMAGVDMVHIPYKGSAPALTDLLGGRVALLFADITVGLPHVKAGKLKPLAVTSFKRSPVVADLPTVAEAGVPGYVANTWWGVVAPAGTPKEIVTKLNTEIVKILRSPDMKERIFNLGAEVVASTPDQYGAYIKEEIVKWAKVVKDSGARID